MPLHAFLYVNSDYSFWRSENNEFFYENGDVFIPKLPDGFFDMDREIFSIGREVKKRLGEDGYLLDSYLSIILEGIRENAIQDAFFNSENAFSDLHKLCIKILEGKHVCDEDIQKHPLYAKEHKSPYTAVALTKLSVTPTVMKKLYHEGKTLYSSLGRIDTVRLHELYERMHPYAGEKLLDRLNELVKTRYIITTAINVYIQAVTDSYLESLLNRDEVTCKQFFQLMIDEVDDQ